MTTPPSKPESADTRRRQQALADKLDTARWPKIIHGVDVQLDVSEMDLARDALRSAAGGQRT